MVVKRLGVRAKMLEATCAVPHYRHIVRCDNQGPGKRTAPQPWDKQRSPTVSRNLGGYSLAIKVMPEYSVQS